MIIPHVEVTVSSLTYVEHAIPVSCIFTNELVGVGVLEDKVSQVEAGDVPCLYHVEGVVLVQNFRVDTPF